MVSGHLAKVCVGHMSDESGSEERRYCPSCGAEAKPGISNCENCWRPLPIGAVGAPPASSPAWTLKTEPTEEPHQDPAPVLTTPAPPGNRSAAAGPIGAREPAAPAKRKRGKKIILIAAVALVLVVGGLIAETAIEGTSITQTQSYKDGYEAGTTLESDFASSHGLYGTSVQSYCQSVGGFDSENNNFGRDNASQWAQGCVAGLNAGPSGQTSNSGNS